MQIEQFLERVLAPGAFFAVDCLIRFKVKAKDENGKEIEKDAAKMKQRMFARADIGGAARLMRWASAHKQCAFYSMATFKVAEVKERDKFGNPVYEGSRKHDNAMAMRSFWMDVDVKDRFADQPAALKAAQQFLHDTRIPAPNMVVNSGNGWHLYWITEDPMTPADWLPYAEALRAATIKHGFPVDTGVIADASRILRPPETYNWKDQERPKEVEVVGQRGEYPVQQMFDALQPYVGLQTRATGTSGVTGGLTGTVSPLFANTKSTGLAAAVQTGFPEPPPRRAANVAAKCEQVKFSLANGGNGDPRNLWYLGWLSLAPFLEDGYQFVHDISKGDPRYDKDNVDKEYRRAVKEKAESGKGAPTCVYIDTLRSGICENCKFYQKITTPAFLGQDDGDLPTGWRRSPAKDYLQRATLVKGKKDDDDKWEWLNVLPGDVYNPQLTVMQNVSCLSFTHEFSKSKQPLLVSAAELLRSTNPGGYFASRCHIELNPRPAQQFSEFIVNWITKLRAEGCERSNALPSFGWHRTIDEKGNEKHEGFAVASVLHRHDGTCEPTPVRDPGMVSTYTPSGSLSSWRQVCDFVLKDRLDLQPIVAASFGSPLMKLTGQRGLIVNAWSRNSGVGKTSAMWVAQTVWGATAGIHSLNHTVNSVIHKVAAGSVMPVLWDEMRTGSWDKQRQATTDFLFQIPQGQEKGRLNADASAREVREWWVLAVCAANAPLVEFVRRSGGTTDAGEMRVFDYEISRPSNDLDPGAQVLIDKVCHHYGRAGETYAHYLGEHYAEALDCVSHMQRVLKRLLAPKDEERFYIAGLACMLAGAYLANQLDLAKFDVKGLRDFLVRATIMLRQDRKLNSMVTNGQFDVEEVLNLYLQHERPYIVKTNRFPNQGPHQAAPIKLLEAPWRTDKAPAVHTAQHDRAIRIAKDNLVRWCHMRGLVAATVINELMAVFNATQTRATIGNGTPFTSSRLQVLHLDIPTSGRGSELVEFLQPTQSAGGGASGPASPAQSLKGN